MEETQKKNPLGELPVGQLLRRFAVPSIVAMLVAALYNIVDQFFIGRSIGELGNAATNVAFPLTTSCISLALMFGIGGAAAFNLAMGKGHRDEAVNYMGNAASMLFICGAVLAVFVRLFLQPLLIFFGAPDNVLGYAMTYTGITSLGFPFLILSSGGGNLIRADGSPRYSMTCNLVGAAINTVLDPLFIFGMDMGMAGAALATIIGQTVAAIMVVLYLRRCRTVKLSLGHLVPKWRYIKRIMSLGAASFFNQMAMMVVQITMNKSLTYYGGMSVYGQAIPLACAGIVSKVNQVFFSVIIGISQGLQPIISFNYGAGRYDRVKKAYLLAIKTGFAIALCAFLIFQLAPAQLMSLFGKGSQEYIDFGVAYFRIFLFFTFLNFMQPISSNLFTSIGKPQKGALLSLTRQIIFLMPLIIFLPMVMGIDGIMYAGPIADLAAAVVASVMVFKEMRTLGVSRVETDGKDG